MREAVSAGSEHPGAGVQFQWKLRIIGVSHTDTPMAVDNFRNFNGNRTSDFH
ncbi:hypothetical protein [Saccharopolyspora sp. ASAGF58]|uniref:hypothetical protein n=1 Tax=Saccharopolyspora sp. ASAGF58 TaxID=2719023 RepID=UPI001445BDE3|nr:hypothetical protein [Saccharopolyspora sp. ASAGF58]